MGGLATPALAETRSKPYTTLSLSVKGMSRPSCAQRVESALSECPGVHEAIVNFDTTKAQVTLDLTEAGPEELNAAVASIGYGLQETQKMEAPMTPTGLPAKLKPYLVGTIAALCVIGFYHGLLTLTSDFYNAWMEFKAYAGWILALSAGLGVQATLFMLLRGKLGGKRMKSAKCSLAASGGMSTSAMAACCSHYLVTLLPVLGLPFLSAAAAGLARYQTYFFLVGVLSSLFGIGLMLRTMKKNGLFFAGALEIEPRLKTRHPK